MTITKESFGRFADSVEDFGGELILPVGEKHEIHPAAIDGKWAVVNHTTGTVVEEFSDIEAAVRKADRCENKSGD